VACDLSLKRPRRYISDMVESSGPTEKDFTVLLVQARAGDEASLRVVWRAAYDELHVMARGIRAGYPQRSTPSPTTIIHEAFLKTFASRAAGAGGSEDATTMSPTDPSWDSRAHFFGSFARAMAQFLIDWHRTTHRLKRGGGAATLPLTDVASDLPSLAPLTDFDQALREVTPALFDELDKLQTDAPDLANVVWLRYMAALSLEDTANILGIAPRTVSKRWNAGRAILRRSLKQRFRDLPREKAPGGNNDGRNDGGKDGRKDGRSDNNDTASRTKGGA
jgi:RNA polymerase sigma factor (TIGR02999 family)